MTTTAHKKIPIMLAAIVLSATSSSAWAEFKITPAVSGQGYVTDNLDLEGARQLDGIAEVTPEVSLLSRGNRHQANARYGLRSRWNQRTEDLSYNHSGSGSGRFDVIKDYLSVYGRGGISQRSNSLTNTQLMDPDLLLTDFSDVGNALAGIKAQNRARRYFSSEADYSYGISRSASTTYADTETHRGNVVLQQGTSFTRTIWKLQGKADLLKNSITEDRKTLSGTFDLGYLIKKGSGAFGSVGYERNPGITGAYGTTEETRGYVATANVFWLWGQYLTTRAMYGKRSFGESYSAAVSWEQQDQGISANFSKEVIGDIWSVSAHKKYKMFDLSSSYSETLTNYNYLQYEESFRLLLDPEGNPLVDAEGAEVSVPVLIGNQSIGNFIRRLARAQMTIKGIRNTIRISGNIERREFLQQNLSGTTYNAEFDWDIKLSPMAHLRMNIKGQDLNDVTLNTNALYAYGSLAYEQKLGRHLETSARLVHWERHPDTATKTSTNIAIASLKLTF